MSTKLKSHNLDTTGWNEFPFSAKGINFMSKVSNDSPLISRIINLPEGMFEKINESAVSDLIEDTSSLESIATRLMVLNLSASHAVLELM